MIDPVTRELETRAAQRWPWRWALALSLVLHSAAGVGLLLAGASPRHTTTLPSVQVRLAAMPMPAPPSAAAQRPPQSRAAAAPPAAAPARPASRPAPRRAAPAPERRATAAPPAAPDVVADTAASNPLDTPASESGPAHLASPSGALALGGGTRGTGTDEAFPYGYYLQRLLALIESNWYAPTAPSATRCRVRARVDRSGRLLEAGISEESGMPSFDRAALRAVFAAAPFPPLPQGFGGTTLTIHLEFGQ